MPKTQSTFGPHLRAYLDQNGKKYTWIPKVTRIGYPRLMRLFSGIEPTMTEIHELANCLGLKVEDMYHLDRFLSQS